RRSDGFRGCDPRCACRGIEHRSRFYGGFETFAFTAFAVARRSAFSLSDRDVPAYRSCCSTRRIRDRDYQSRTCGEIVRTYRPQYPSKALGYCFTAPSKVGAIAATAVSETLRPRRDVPNPKR